MEHIKQRRLTLAILLVVVLVCSIGLTITLLPNDAKAAAAPDRGDPYATVYLGRSGRGDSNQGIYNRTNFVRGWADAISFAQEAYELEGPEAYVRVVLDGDWIAADTKSGDRRVKYFSAEDSIDDVECFDNGRILVPGDTNIEIDLNGHTISRDLTDAGVSYGHVLIVRGTLTVVDNGEDGQITGGYNLANTATGSAFGGGVYVHGGTLNLYGGSIVNNKAGSGSGYGAGVYVTGSGENDGMLNMYDGATIANNSFNVTGNSYGGGICVYSNATFNMYGGVVEGNTSIFGGGIAAYDVNGVGINIEGGIIRNNAAFVASNKDSGGGAIFANINGDVNISGGEICYNRSNSYGGAIYIVGNNSTTAPMNLYLSGASIHHNVAAALDRNVFGGGVAIRRSESVANIFVNAKMSAGDGNSCIIENNYAIANCENEDTYLAQGAGVAILNAEFTLESGEIRNNRTYSVAEGASQEDLDAICEGLMQDNLDGIRDNLKDGQGAFGGGVYCYSNPSWNTPTGSLIMLGGSIHNNRANVGGGIYMDGSWELRSGNVSDNFGLAGDAIHLTEASEVRLSGNPVVRNNYSVFGGNNGTQVDSNLQVPSEDYKLYIDGVFSDDAIIHLFVSDSMIEKGVHLTKGYDRINGKFVSLDGSDPDDAENPTNGIWAYINPCNFFVLDTAYLTESSTGEQHLMVFANGELGVARKTIAFTVTYSDESSETFTFGEALQNMPVWNFVEWTYDSDAKRPVSISAEGVDELEIANAAKVYTLSVSTGAGDTETVFSAVVHTKELGEDDVVIELSDDKFSYDGTAKEPSSCVVTLKTPVNGKTVLVAGEDYTISYKNNVDAGQNTAIVVITFIGNFSGEARAYFSIEPAEDDKLLAQVEWQVEVDGEWITFDPATEAPTFTFNAENQGGKIRARLTIQEGSAPYYKTIYAEGLITEDALQHASMYIEFKLGEEKTSFVNTGKYTLTLVGYANYRILDEDRSIEAEITQLHLNLSTEDFANYQDENDTRLWLLQFDDQLITLIDEAIYLDPNASANEHDEKVTNGKQLGGFARFRDTAMSLVLNGSYKLPDGRTLGELLAIAASVTYTPANGTVGTRGEVEDVTTIVTITFDNNYYVNEENSITLSWSWKIVTISNSLRTDEGSEDYVTNLTGWTFADPSEVQAYAFRAEHGNTVIYSYFKADDPDFVKRFAIVYSGDTLYASRSFYEVKLSEDNKSWVVDFDKPINDSNFLVNFNYELRAGAYTMQVTIPELEPSREEHTHWWDGEAAIDYGTMYYEFTYTFHFTVEKNRISYEDYATNGIVKVIFPENIFIEYTGTTNNIVEPEIWLHDVKLEKDVDYALSSVSKDIGRAVLTITGINSLEGGFTIADAYEIIRARNGWKDIPYIMQWTYNSYDSQVNLIKATPMLLDTPSGMWFSISTDEAGQNLIAGLGHFTIGEDGQVSAEVANILKELHRGTYYLIGHVEGTDNYYELEEQIIAFTVFQANNVWEVTPSVNTWTEGEFTETLKHILIAPTFGTPHVLIVDEKGNVYYDTDNGIDLLATAKHGHYTLTAYVDGTDDYTALAEYMLTFDIFAKPGLPWWVTLLVSVGALAVAALIIFILWKNGVFRVITDKILVSIRTRVSVEATIASARAAKMMEEGKKSVEAAKRKERLEQMRQKAKEMRELPPEERAAIMEAKAQAAEAKAQADAKRAEKLRKQADKAAREHGTATVAATEEPTAPVVENAPTAQESAPEATQAQETAETPAPEAQENPTEE